MNRLNTVFSGAGHSGEKDKGRSDTGGVKTVSRCVAEVLRMKRRDISVIIWYCCQF